MLEASVIKLNKCRLPYITSGKCGNSAAPCWCANSSSVVSVATAQRPAGVPNPHSCCELPPSSPPTISKAWDSESLAG